VAPHGRVTAGGVPATDQDVGAALGQQRGGGAADAAGRSGHQRGRSGEIVSCHVIPFHLELGYLVHNVEGKVGCPIQLRVG
jgi:hypothetical protein